MASGWNLWAWLQCIGVASRWITLIHYVQGMMMYRIVCVASVSVISVCVCVCG